MKFAGPLGLINEFDHTHLYHAATGTGPLEFVSDRKPQEGAAYWREDGNPVRITIDILGIDQSQAEIFA